MGKRKADSSMERRNVRKQRKMIPALVPIENREDLPIHEQLSLSGDSGLLPSHIGRDVLLVHITSHAYGSLYSVNSVSDNEPVWSAFITKSEFDFRVLKKFCKKTGFLCPRYSVSGNSRGVRSLIYPRFETLPEYLAKHPNFILTRNFRNVIKGIIRSMCVAQQSNYVTWEIMPENLVVLEGKCGAVLDILSHERPEPRSSIDYSKGFSRLGKVLDDLITTTQVADRNFLSFKHLLSCIGEVDSREKAWRLLRTPFFLCDQVIVREFIHRLNTAAFDSPLFLSEVNKIDVTGWQGRISKCIYREAREIFAGKQSSYYKETEKAASNLLRCLRNVSVHGDQNLQAMEECVEKHSQLLKQPRIFLGFIQDVQPDFIDGVVLKSFQTESTIPILDYSSG